MLVGMDLPLGGPVYIVSLIAMPVVMIFLKEPLCHKLEWGKDVPTWLFGAFFTEALL